MDLSEIVRGYFPTVKVKESKGSGTQTNGFIFGALTDYYLVYNFMLKDQ
jgi:hypothetical protein